jgi:hypothetical protein
MVLIGMIRERTLLLAIGGVIGVSEVEHNGSRGRCVTGDERVHEGLRQPLEVFPVSWVFQTRKGRGPGSIWGRSPGRALHPEFEEGVTAKTLGVIGVRIPRGDLIDALGEEVSPRRVDRGLVPLLTDRRRKALGQTNLTVNTAEQECPKV